MFGFYQTFIFSQVIIYLVKTIMAHTYSQLIDSLKPVEKELSHKDVRVFFKIGIADYCLLSWNQIQTLVKGYCHAHNINYNDL